MLGWLLLFAALSAAGTAAARAYALQRRLIDAPGDRRSHAVATPRGGGVAILAAMLVACTALAVRFPLQRTLLALVGAGLALVGLVGWLDDHRPTPIALRLAVHALAAGLLGAALWMAYGNPRLALAAAVAALVLVNAWNFMDGINGIAAGQALLVAAAVAWATGGAVGWLALALAAACAGFLPFNAPRARIFLGDVGSGALGYAIASLLALAVASGRVDPWLALLPASAFLVDTGLTLLRRILRRERWWTAHAQHAYQAAARRWGHGRVALGYAAWTAASLGLAVWLQGAPAGFTGSGVIAWYTCAAFAWWGLQRSGPPQPAATERA